MNKQASDIGCIIVTFNRIEKLKKTLDSYAKQNLLPKYILVVNNASTDGTAMFLKQWEKKDEGFEKIVLNSATNVGVVDFIWEKKRLLGLMQIGL